MSQMAQQFLNCKTMGISVSLTHQMLLACYEIRPDSLRLTNTLNQYGTDGRLKAISPHKFGKPDESVGVEQPFGKPDKTVPNIRLRLKHYVQCIIFR